MRRANWRRPSLRLQTPSDRTSALHTPWPRRWWMSLASKSKFSWKLNFSQWLFDYSPPFPPSLSLPVISTARWLSFVHLSNTQSWRSAMLSIMERKRRPNCKSSSRRTCTLIPRICSPLSITLSSPSSPSLPLLSQHGPCWGPYPG